MGYGRSSLPISAFDHIYPFQWFVEGRAASKEPAFQHPDLSNEKEGQSQALLLMPFPSPKSPHRIAFLQANIPNLRSYFFLSRLIIIILLYTLFAFSNFILPVDNHQNLAA
jgi:hypothetical protein